MFFPARLKTAPVVLAVFLAACLYTGAEVRADSSVQTYTDQSAPLPPPSGLSRYDSPLRAGQMTLQDVLGAHPKKAAPPAAKDLSATAPLLAPSAGGSSANVMMMQGLESALREKSTGAAPQLKAPQMQPAALAPAPSAASPYQPGQEPRNLATGAPAPQEMGNGEIPRATDMETAPAPLSQANIPSGIAGGGTRATTPSAPVAAGGPCTPHVESWEKTCAEAGYPATYIGKIVGETRTLCPSGDLQDVWMENSCTPPGPGAQVPAMPAPKAAARAMTPPEMAPPEMAPAPETASPAPSSSATVISIPPSAPAGSAAAPAAEMAPPVMVPETESAPANMGNDGSCGPANGLASYGKPAGDLCAAGHPSEVRGEGPWHWLCIGTSGGMTVSCAAPVASSAPQPNNNTAPSSAAMPSASARQDGKCGVSSGVVTDMAPELDLCAQGMPSRVSGDGPWTWACSGSNGGTAAACAAPKRIDGACGPAAGGTVHGMPRSGLCAAGYASAVTGNGPWNWTCSGLHGGAPALCAAEPRRDAVCGPASVGGHQVAPATNLCSAGNPSEVVGDGPWLWTCAGLGGGASVSCTAAVSANGQCGLANGTATTEAPADGLCDQGLPSRVTGNGPWRWTCNGTGGGEAQSCVAPLKAGESKILPKEEPGAHGICGMAAGRASDKAPADNLCTTGTSSGVSAGKDNWTWTCTSEMSGASTYCSAPRSSAAAKESDAGQPTVSQPITVPPTAPVKEPAKEATPTAPVPAVSAAAQKSEASCGLAAEAAALKAPDKELCGEGTASAVSGSGPWHWECADNVGRAVSCSTLGPAGSAPAAMAEESKPAAAPAAAVAPVPEAAPSMPVAVKAAEEPAACGPAAEAASAVAPAGGLCAVGKASAVRGKGPWNWTCTKSKKNKISCEAQKLVDGACGAANGATVKLTPSRDLCSSGTASEIEGAGPWMWTCVGSGGGSNASCSANSQPQERIDGMCGAAANVPATSMPSANLCDNGGASAVHGKGPWTWTCSGQNGGAAASCETERTVPAAPPPPPPSVDGLCGPSNGVAASGQPQDGLCSSGTATQISGDGPWNWNCLGINGGMTVSCTAPLQPPAPVTGACGGASGVPTLTIPKSGLCGAGISSAVSGRGPWTWSCSGTNGGGAVACVAPLAGSGGSTEPLPSLVTPSDAPAAAPAPAPKKSKAKQHGALTTPKLPEGSSLPPIEAGAAPSLQPSKQWEEAPTGAAPPPFSVSGEAVENAPQAAPDLPSDVTPLAPPPIRDSIGTSAALKAPLDEASIPGNHFVLDKDISSIAFKRGSENIDPDALPQLNKLVSALQSHGGVRVTLTAYADSNGTTPRDARRLSLARALAVRDYLTAKGVSSGRIDVRALGANVPSGDPDRIDVGTN